MATVTGYTAARMKEIEDASVVDGDVVGDSLILIQKDGTQINAGSVRGPQGIQGPAGDVPEAPSDGKAYARKDVAWTEVVEPAAIAALPQGVRGYDSLSTLEAIGTTTNEVTSTGLLVNGVVIAAGRRTKTSLYIRMKQVGTGNNYVNVKVYRGATQVFSGLVQLDTNGNGIVSGFGVEENVAAGTYNYTVTVQQTLANDLSIRGDSSKCHLLIEDLGAI